jgi:hypothetical protein
VAAATENGLWLSTDFGSTFAPAFTAEPVTSVAFNLDEDELYFGYRQLYRLDLATGESTALPTPTLTTNDALLYIANSPTSDLMAVATSEKDVFMFDGNTSWTQIASDGIGGA